MLKVLFIVLDLIDILMHIKSIVLGYFDYAGCNVGAMVGNSLEIVKKVGENESVLDTALALLKSQYVVKLDLIAKIVNYLFKRLDLLCKSNVIFNECLAGEVYDIVNCS